MNSIKSKILSIYSFLIFLIFVVALIAIYNLYSLNNAVDGLIASNYNSIVAANHMIHAIERQDSNELIYMQVEKDKSIKNFYLNQKEFITWLSKARDNITEGDESGVLDRISESYIKYNELFSKLQEVENIGGSQEAGYLYDKEIYLVFSSIKKDCEELLGVNETAMLNSKERATINSRRQMYATAAISLCAIALGLIVATVYTRRIVKPIYSLTGGIKAIKEGNLNQAINVESLDEIGELAKEFNNMTRRLLIYEKSNIKSLISERNKSLAIVKSISDPIIVTDNNYKILLINKTAESIFNIYEADVIGKHFLENVDNKLIFNQIKNTIENGAREEDNEIINLNIKGKARFYLISVTTIMDNDNLVIGTVTVLQDITALKEIERVKSNFISTISHELRTPLTSIVMGSSLLLDNMIGNLNGDQMEIVQAMDEDSKQLLALVNDLLNLSRIESGKLEMHFEETSISSIVKAVEKTFADIAGDRGVKLLCEIEENLPKVSADISKITCVINNLITNALKFTNSGDEIRILSWPEEDNITVCIEDTGIGIPEESQHTIFDKFIQLNQNSEGRNGTGLGLAIAKEFIEKHGGRIWVESRPEEGSRFMFTLPR